MSFPLYSRRLWYLLDAVASWYQQPQPIKQAPVFPCMQFWITTGFDARSPWEICAIHHEANVEPTNNQGKLFTLESINNLILDFNYGANEVKNKPNFLMTKELVSEDHGLNQSGEI